jgi:hypothetical protein
MKNLFRISAVAALTLTVLFSCKKGENDPFLSLKSRDARITGVWNLTELTQINSNTFSGTTVSDTYTIMNGVDSDGDSYSIKWEILKDGTYISTTILNGEESTSTGYWGWVNSKKDKIAIEIGGDSYRIDRLSNKDLHIYEEYSSTSPSSSSNNTFNMKFEKE